MAVLTHHKNYIIRYLPILVGTLIDKSGALVIYRSPDPHPGNDNERTCGVGNQSSKIH
jgi:hypothetical protein